jgi:hypothetical protein
MRHAAAASRIAVSLLGLLAGGTLVLAAGGIQPTGVVVDSARHRVIVTAGPFHVPTRAPMLSHMSMHMEGGDSLVKQFPWPVTSLLQGLSLELLDAHGRLLPRRLLHHLNLVDFDRRQLVYPLVERLMGFGQETEDVSLPKSIGLPLSAGQRLGLFVMWDNETGQALDGVTVRLTFRYAAPNLQPHPIPVMPFIIDAHLVIGGHNIFSVPPGGIVKAFDFTLPLSGHLIAAGGHLHDHGIWVRLLDLTSGKTIVTVRAKRDSTGHVSGMSRELLALRGAGPHLRADHRYRLEARYDNPTGDTLPGMMALMVGLFAPDHPAQWPAIDPGNRDYRTDIASMFGPGGAPAGSPEVHPGHR